MKIATRFAAFALAASMLSPAALFAQPGYGRGQWDAPPGSYRRDLERNAFRDGINGGRKDFENRRRIDVNNRDEYRNYRGPNARAYRDAFRAGYQAFWRHQGPPR
jgi:hypothetical protein